MFPIFYKIGCRKCTQTDGKYHTHLIKGDEIKFREKSEFEVMKLIESWCLDNKYICKFCESNNFEVSDINIRGYLLYDDNKLSKKYELNKQQYLQINISKHGDQLKLSVGGSYKIDADFFQKAFLKILQTTSDSPNKYFKFHYKGNFFVCVSESAVFLPEIETLSNMGLTINEIIDGLNQIAIQIKLKLKINEIKNYQAKFNINSIFFNSNLHLRYNDGEPIPIAFYNANRKIEIKSIMNSNACYLITIYNLDLDSTGYHSNIQMSSKQMKVIEQIDNKIILKGYGVDNLGFSFEDYGMTLIMNKEQIESCILHLYDRKTEIEYL